MTTLRQHYKIWDQRRRSHGARRSGLRRCQRSQPSGCKCAAAGHEGLTRSAARRQMRCDDRPRGPNPQRCTPPNGAERCGDASQAPTCPLSLIYPPTSVTVPHAGTACGSFSIPKTNLDGDFKKSTHGRPRTNRKMSAQTVPWACAQPAPYCSARARQGFHHLASFFFLYCIYFISREDSHVAYTRQYYHV